MTSTTAEILPPRTLTEIEEEAIANKPIKWGQLALLMEYAFSWSKWRGTQSTRPQRS